METEQTNKKQEMNKKGQVGFDTSKAVMLAIMFIGVFAFVIIILMSNLSNTDVAAVTGNGDSRNETLSPNVTAAAVSFAESGREDVRCTITQIDARSSHYNVTIVGILSGNYTQSNCAIAFAGADSQFNNTVWRAHYLFTYNSFTNVKSNITNGTVGFFSNVGTWFALLSVVIIILIIGIVIFAVSRFSDKTSTSL